MQGAGESCWQRGIRSLSLPCCLGIQGGGGTRGAGSLGRLPRGVCSSVRAASWVQAVRAASRVRGAVGLGSGSGSGSG